MDAVAIAETAVAALSPYLIELAKGAAGKAGEAAYQGAAKLLDFLKRKLIGAGEQQALSRLELEPGEADNQAALRVALRESLERDAAFLKQLEALLKALPRAGTTQSANVAGSGNVVTQVAGDNIHTTVGDRK